MTDLRPLKAYINNETMKYIDEWLVICSGGAGGTIGVGWVLLLQPERGECDFKIYAIIIFKYVV